MPIGTAHMAHLALSNSVLCVGVDFARDKVVNEILDDPSATTVLLYPGKSAKSLNHELPSGPVNLVVVDGTWAHARKVVASNPRLAALPRYTFEPDQPSEYRIRREPSEECVSTIEAIAFVLGLLEKDPERFSQLRIPFRAMIDKQIAYVRQTRDLRDQEEEGGRLVPPPVPRPRALLQARYQDLVCVVGEANIWPKDGPEKHPEDLIHWLAVRPSSAERFEALIVPRQPMYKWSCSHCGLAADDMREAVSFSEFDERWRSFLRPNDIICTWRDYASRLLLRDGGFLPAERLCLRQMAGNLHRCQLGSLERYVEERSLACEVMGRGRGGERLGKLAATVENLLQSSPPSNPSDRPAPRYRVG